MYCTESMDGEPNLCSACGHTSLVHPGPLNPALIHCAVCELVTLSAEVAEALADLDAATSYVNQSRPDETFARLESLIGEIPAELKTWIAAAPAVFMSLRNWADNLSPEGP